MLIEQKLSFKKAYKKLKPNQKADADKAIKAVISNPDIGAQKKGDLAWLRVYKFKMVGRLTLLAYSVDEGKITLTFIAIDSHENFYRDLK